MFDTSPAASAAFSGSTTRVNAVSVTRMPTRSLVRISCAVTSSGVGRVSTFCDLHRAAHRPERVPARRQPLGELAVDEQQARLVRLDHRMHDQRHARQVELVEVALGDAHLGAGIDALDRRRA